MELDAAKWTAEVLAMQMEKYCERVEIAGSIRREKPEVKDIELCVIPKWKTVPVVTSDTNLFETKEPETERVNELHVWATRVQTILTWIKPGTQDIIPWQPKPEGKYWRATLLGPGRVQIKLDLFLTKPDNWGIIYLIRTGAAEFSAAILGHAKHHTPYQSESSYFEEHGVKGKPEGYLVSKETGERVETREEADVFALLGLEYIEPKDRIDGSSLRRLKR